MRRSSKPKVSTRAMLILVLALVGVILVSRSIVAVSQYPVRQVAQLRRQLDAAKDLKFDRRVELETTFLQYETDSQIKIWTAVIQAAGGTALLLGLFFTARNLQATQAKLDIDRQGQLTNRFIQATGQLGAEKGGQPNVEVRLGGIYALNRISNDWPKDYWPIVDVLTAYVRHNARWTASAVGSGELTPRTDIQAILTVLGRNDPPEAFNEHRKLDLRNTDLRGAEFWDARLEWADFWGAHLDGAKFWGAVLRHAKLDHAQLSRANLRAANLESASLEGADLTGAVFDRDTVWPTGFDALEHGAILIADGSQTPEKTPHG